MKHLNTHKRLTVPEKHALKIARQTMKMHCAGAAIMGGQTHYDAANVIHELTGAIVEIHADCTCHR